MTYLTTINDDNPLYYVVKCYLWVVNYPGLPIQILDLIKSLKKLIN